jgi:hypothetical protein
MLPQIDKPNQLTPPGAAVDSRSLRVHSIAIVQLWQFFINKSVPLDLTKDS